MNIFKWQHGLVISWWFMRLSFTRRSRGAWFRWEHYNSEEVRFFDLSWSNPHKHAEWALRIHLEMIKYKMWKKEWTNTIHSYLIDLVQIIPALTGAWLMVLFQEWGPGLLLFAYGLWMANLVSQSEATE